MSTTNDPTVRNDETLQREAVARLAKSAEVQLAHELLGKLRGGAFAWWTPASLRERFSAKSRLRWLKSRPDIRQRITTELTGLSPKAARKQAHELQADLIDAALDEGDVDVERFERAFGTDEIATHGPISDHWLEFRRRVPWTEDTAQHRDLALWLLRRLLSDRSEGGSPRTPILTPLAVRRGIPARTWQTHIPLDVRAAVDEARSRHEERRPGEPFGADRELELVTVEVVAAQVPLPDLAGVWDAAEAALGWATRPTSSKTRDLAPTKAATTRPEPGLQDFLPRDETFEFGSPAQAK